MHKREHTLLLLCSLVAVCCSTNNRFWTHKGNSIRYLAEASSVSTAPPVLCIHGFGGNADQFRYNMPALKNDFKVAYAMDLLGYGYSDKPNPRDYGVNELYNFENWGEQICSFISEVACEPTVIVANSVGGVAALQAAATRPDLVKGVVLINISMRMLHLKKQSFFQRPVVNAIQTVLRETDIGRSFFKSVATPNTLRNILNQVFSSRLRPIFH
jgi:pimeloyl-ACP methyl ester carboxylesterase